MKKKEAAKALGEAVRALKEADKALDKVASALCAEMGSTAGEERFEEGIRNILHVMDWATDSSIGRQNQYVWTINSLRDLLAGRRVEVPSAHFFWEKTATVSEPSHDCAKK